MKDVLKYDDALVRITLVYEHGQYRFEFLDFNEPIGWMGCDPLGKVIRRGAVGGYLSQIYIRVPHGGNATSGISDEARVKRKKAISMAQRRLLRDEVARLLAQEEVARKTIIEIKKVKRIFHQTLNGETV